MLAKVFSKPIFRLSVVILVNENILRVAPLIGKDVKQRYFARWSSRKPSKVFTPDQVSSGGFDTEEFYKSEYSESSEKQPRLSTETEYEQPWKNQKKMNEEFRPSGGLGYTVLEENDITFRYRAEIWYAVSLRHLVSDNNKNIEIKGQTRTLNALIQSLLSDLAYGYLSFDFDQTLYRAEIWYAVSLRHLVSDNNKNIEIKGQTRTLNALIQSLLSDLAYGYLSFDFDQTLKLITQVGNRKMRRKNDIIMLEGKRLNVDALKAGLRPKKIFITQKSYLEELNISPDLNIPVFKIPYKTLALWSRLETPPGVVGFYSLVKEGDIKTWAAIPVKVVCDNVRDPGNMGSIIRVAASVGCTEVVLLKGCTDPWDSKVLRAGSGGHFHVPIKMDMMWSDYREFLSPSDLVFLTDSRTDRTDSLGCKVPLHLYHDVNYRTPHSVVIVIGGETEGLSMDAFKLAIKFNGSRIYIPMSNCVESLNSGCALSVVLFEAKRQFLTGENTNGRSRIEKSSSSGQKSQVNKEEGKESRIVTSGG